MANVQKAQQTDKPKACKGKNPDPTTSYRVSNWKEYDAALKRRGSVTLWFDNALVQSWYTEHEATRQRGGQVLYNHSTMNRRAASLDVPLYAGKRTDNIHIVVDSTGVKVYGEGEWKVRQHGIGKRRTWRKLHLGVDESSNLILSASLTSNAVDDAAELAWLLIGAKEFCPNGIGQCSGDGAYDKIKCYDALAGIRATIPLRKDAKIQHHGNRKAVGKHPRDENIRAIGALGRRRWKQECGYHRRSKAEVAMFCYKTIFGSMMQAREMKRQQCESIIKCRILNLMVHNGMPQTAKIIRAVA